MNNKNMNNYKVEIIKKEYEKGFVNIFIKVPEISDRVLEIGIDEDGCVCKQGPGDVVAELMGGDNGDYVHDNIVNKISEMNFWHGN